MSQTNLPLFFRSLTMRRIVVLLLGFGFMVATSSVCLAMITVGSLDKAKAKEKYGITMHARQNGTAGVQVWLEFKKQGWLEKLTYVELQMTDEEGKQLISARLAPGPVRHGQPEEVTSVAFSADASQLSRCQFMIVCYGSSEGDVGYTLAVKDFLDMNDPITDK